MTNQSYCTWMIAHSSAVTTITGQTSRGARSQPRNRKPRNRVSSPIGVTTTTASHSNGSHPAALGGAINVELKRVTMNAAEQPAQHIAGDDEHDDGGDAEHHLAAARHRQAEIVGSVAAMASAQTTPAARPGPGSRRK